MTAPTVASLPAAAANPGTIMSVIDGSSGTDCTAGGGASFVFCKSNGSTWVAVSNNPANCTASSPGLVPTPPNSSSEFLDGTCHFSSPASAASLVLESIASHGGRTAYVQTTATTTSSSTAVALADGSGYVNGDGVTIHGAGATNTMTTPTGFDRSAIGGGSRHGHWHRG